MVTGQDVIQWLAAACPEFKADPILYDSPVLLFSAFGRFIVDRTHGLEPDLVLEQCWSAVNLLFQSADDDWLNAAEVGMFEQICDDSGATEAAATRLKGAALDSFRRVAAWAGGLGFDR